MATIDNILFREGNNKSLIYLYGCGEQWYAYEHSAYHFSQLFQQGKIEQMDGFIRLGVSELFEFLYLQAMNSVEVVAVDDYEMKIDCGSVFPGFEAWKEQLLLQPVLTE